jgi:hypothetical protein
MEPSNTNLNKELVQSLIENINNKKLGVVKQLSQEERNVLKTAIKSFFKGERAEVSNSIVQKITNPRVYPKPRTVEIANRTLWKMLGNCLPVQGTEEIVISGQVLGDGRGDWAAIRNMQKSLQKKFPERTVRIIASSTEKWNKPGLLDTTKIKALDLIYYGNNTVMGANVPLIAFPTESNIIEKVQKAAVIISAGVGIESVFKSVLDEIHEKSIKIYEHDFATASSDEGFGSIILQTGINPANNRAGIFTTTEKEYTWDQLANAHLKSVLFGTDNPEEKEIRKYRSKHECFFGYMHKPANNFAFIRDAAVFSDANFPGKSIDVCLPGFCKNKETGIIDSEVKASQKNWTGIDKLVVIWYDGDQKKERSILLGEVEGEGKGKEIRIIDPGNMSAKDFKIMTSISAPLVGCTGDNSLAQALSSGKIPCYESRFSTKVLGLLLRIEENFGTESDLYKYCDEVMNGLPEYRSSSDAGLPELMSQAKQLGKFMREEAAFQPVLRGVVNEKLLRQKDPDFATREDLLRQAYLENKISMEELNDQFTVLLSEKGLL